MINLVKYWPTDITDFGEQKAATDLEAVVLSRGLSPSPATATLDHMVPPNSLCTRLNGLGTRLTVTAILYSLGLSPRLILNAKQEGNRYYPKHGKAIEQLSYETLDSESRQDGTSVSIRRHSCRRLYSYIC